MIKTISDDFFNKAMAFLEVAIISSKEKENIYFHTAEYSNVTAYLVYHATELFLKFAIFQASKKLVEGHDIFKLYEKYKKCYSDEKLKINIPFTKPEDVCYGDLPEEQIQKFKAKYKMSFEQQLKYPIDKENNIYNLITIFDTEWLESYKDELFKLYFELKKVNSCI